MVYYICFILTQETVTLANVVVSYFLGNSKHFLYLMQTLLDIYCMKSGFSFVQVSKAHYNGGKVLDASPRWWYNVIKKMMVKPIRIRMDIKRNCRAAIMIPTRFSIIRNMLRTIGKLLRSVLK